MNKDEQLTIRISAVTKRKLKKEAKRQERTMSSLITWILKEALK